MVVEPSLGHAYMEVGGKVTQGAVTERPKSSFQCILQHAKKDLIKVIPVISRPQGTVTKDIDLCLTAQRSMIDMTGILFISIFRLSGAYVGVLTSDGWFFDAEGRYIGWHDENSQVWHRDGTYLGEIIDENYILRRQGWQQSVRKTPKVPPIAPELPAAPQNRIPITAKPGWVDTLGNILRKPETSELHGQWAFQEGVVTFSVDQQYTLLVNGQSEETGVWQLRGNLIMTPQQRSEEQPTNVVYQILEFSPDKMVMRRLVHEERSLPFSMIRETE